MLFSSFAFVVLFLPICAVGFFVIAARAGAVAAMVWLLAASIVFYGWWNPVYVVLLAGSVTFNFLAGRRLAALAGTADERAASWLLAFAITANLTLLGFFKYADFTIANINWLADANLPAAHIALPLAISFFTFQQIAYLVDARRGETRENSFWRYFLFVSFFPQLIAGPIVHHKEMMPQFAATAGYRLDWDRLAVGLSVFLIGLTKKLVIADTLAPHANWVFQAAEAGHVLTLWESWGGALAYTGQIYFDFSGYSDMAIGLAWMFGIRLPLNFFSPYQATSIIDFWRRWHMTLSRFLRDYLYIPLGGNRRGRWRRLVNLMITMLLGGLWHGAAWTFVIWGGLHGVYLIINHAWRAALPASLHTRLGASWLWRRSAHLMTFVAVVVAWVFFRADSFAAAGRVLAGMSGANGLGEFANHVGFFGKSEGFIWIALALLVAFVAPNAHQIMGDRAPAIAGALATRAKTFADAVRWRPGLLALVWGEAMVLASFYVMMRFGYEEFIYAFF